MSKKDRDYTVIIKGCKDMEEAVKTLQTAAKAMNACADSAEATLKDKVGQKDIRAVKELAETITKVTATGEERILELQRRMEAEDRAVQEMEGGR